MRMERKGVKRGVSVYSYAGEYGVTMTLEDIFADIHSMGARGLEILGNSHIPDYPNPSEAWIERWFELMEKYDLVPVEYGHWVDSRLYQGRELSTEESLEMLIRDFKIANRLGFPILRTKLGVIDETLTPVKNWKEFITAALPYAEKYNVVMCPEIHEPTTLDSAMVQEYCEFIDKTGTKHFGLNIDFGIFREKELPKDQMDPGRPPMEHSKPEELGPYLPYVYCCHAKFIEMSDDLEEIYIPYDRIIAVLQENNWDGYVLSEYEGFHRGQPGVASDQVRRQHAMLKRLIGE